MFPDMTGSNFNHRPTCLCPRDGGFAHHQKAGCPGSPDGWATGEPDYVSAVVVPFEWTDVDIISGHALGASLADHGHESNREGGI